MKHLFQDISLVDRNSFHIEQRADSLIEFESVDDLIDIFTHNSPEQWCVLSGGNNILFTKDYKGLLLTPVNRDIEIVQGNERNVVVRVGAGLEWDDFVAWAVENQLWGVENLSKIPGKCGAAPVQNIGAYGAEAKDVIQSVEMFSVATCNTLILSAEHCQFGYRDSIFKRSLKGRVIITSVVMCLSREPKPNVRYGDLSIEVESRGGATLENIRESVIAIRDRKIPSTDVLGNGGSFFKNPIVDIHVAEALKSKYEDMPIYKLEADAEHVKIAAGWMIDKAGMKGYRQGAVGVHEAQALVLVNHGGATGEQVMELARMVQAKVKECFGVEIELEINVL